MLSTVCSLLSLRMLSLSLGLLQVSTLFLLTTCAVVEYNFNITWVWTNPAGSLARPVIGVNQQWPPPTIRASVDDIVLVKVLNSLGNQSTSLHFHGLFMNGSAHMDGTSYISQCSILPGASFTYNFTIQQPGTYWYHSHEKSQYPDGLRGAMIIQHDKSPYRSQYQEEVVLTLSDWYDVPITTLLREYDHSAAGSSLHDPLPDGNLINDSRGIEIHVDRKVTTYLLRVINIGAFAGQYLWVDAHEITVVEVDGIYIEPQMTDRVYLATGQRYSLLLTTKGTASGRYAITSQIDKGSFSMHETWTKKLDATAWLVYDDGPAHDHGRSVAQLRDLDEMAFVPLDGEPLLSDVDETVSIVIDMKKQPDGLTHWQFDSSPFKLPADPLLHLALSPNNSALRSITSTRMLNHNSVIELVVRNKHMRKHPLHLHGHTFQIIRRSKGYHAKPANPQVPPRRDTILLESHQTVTIRFRADNPGVWLFHCHMEWHAHSGLMMAFVEAPYELQKQSGMVELEGRIRDAGGRICGSSRPGQEEDPKLDDQKSHGVSTSDTAGSSMALLSSGVFVLLLILSIVLILSVGGFTAWRSFYTPVKSYGYALVPLQEEQIFQESRN